MTTKYMRNIATFILTVLIHSFSFAQTATELYNKKDYQSLIKLETQAEQLNPKELYMIGFAFFQLANDTKAIEFYDKAIDKGYNDAAVHFYKGLSLNYSNKYNDALKELDIAIKAEPENQEYLNEKGLVFYNQKQYDKALEIFEQAKKLPNTYQAPFYYVPSIYHIKKDYDKALSGYYEALTNISKTSDYYLKTLKSIGQLEFSVTKNYTKASKAYSEAIQLDSKNYEVYYKLIKSYNAEKAFSKADSVFNLVKIAFTNGELPKEDMEIKTIAISQFEWNGQIAVIRKSLVDPKEILDISYKVFLLNKTGEEVERRFVVEKATTFGKESTNHLLCEQVKKTGGHITYPYGWSTDNIKLEDLEKAVKLVLDGKMKYSAASNFENK